jgi:hypothetical protein
VAGSLGPSNTAAATEPLPRSSRRSQPYFFVKDQGGHRLGTRGAVCRREGSTPPGSAGRHWWSRTGPRRRPRPTPRLTVEVETRGGVDSGAHRPAWAKLSFGLSRFTEVRPERELDAVGRASATVTDQHSAGGAQTWRAHRRSRSNAAYQGQLPSCWTTPRKHPGAISTTAEMLLQSGHSRAARISCPGA